MQVAKANDIKYAPTECHYEGDCAGTCPKCEGEVRWLEQQLQLRRQLGKAVAVVGVSMGLAALTACDGKFSNRTAGEAEIAPDSLSEVNSAADPCATSPDTVPDSLLAIRQAINSKVAVRDSSDVSEATEPETALIQGEIITDIPEPVSTPSYPGGKQALLDAEALRVVKLMPKWEPGYQNGAPVRVKYNIPVTFKLGEPSSLPSDKSKDN